MIQGVEFKLEVNDKEVIINPENHEYTLIWIHGLNESPEKHLAHMLSKPLLNTLKNFRVVLPRAPIRYVTSSDANLPSWFDVKFRSQQSFLVDFDQAFNSKQVYQSFQLYLKPIIDREHKLLKQPHRLFIGGFSQGCAMALHSFYQSKIQWAGVIGVSAYLFPITKFDKENKTPKRIIHGTQDILRPWEFVKVTYEGKIGKEDIVLVEGVGHQMKPAMIHNVSEFIESVINKTK